MRKYSAGQSRQDRRTDVFNKLSFIDIPMYGVSVQSFWSQSCVKVLIDSDPMPSLHVRLTVARCFDITTRL
jgi:hypothetical protein